MADRAALGVVLLGLAGYLLFARKSSAMVLPGYTSGTPGSGNSSRPIDVLVTPIGSQMTDQEYIDAIIAAGLNPADYGIGPGAPVDEIPSALTPPDDADPADRSADTPAPQVEGLPSLQPTGYFNMTTNWRVNDYSRYAAAIKNAETRWNLPYDLLGRLLFQESRYRPEIINGSVRSRAGATGIAQFMPATAAQFGIDPTDPLASINAAGKYLNALFQMFGTWELALAGYNWGPGNVRKYQNGVKTMPAETQIYVAQISADVPIAVA